MKLKLRTSDDLSISAYLSFLTTILITIIIIALAGYVSYYAKGMAQSNQENIQSLNYSMASLVFKVFSEDYKKNDFSNIKLVIETLEANKMLVYAYVTDSENKNVIWADNSSLIGIKAPEMHYLVKMNMNSQEGKLHEIKGNTQQYNIILGFISSGLSSKSPDTLLFHLQILMAIAIIAGGLASIVLISIIINKPLSNLAKGVAEFGKGNLKFRIEKAKYKEINQLVDAYNYMAFQLNELYESLELKVQERTIELERANQNLKDAQVMMVHSEKMRSLGELVAGIAHEINNPVNFIHGNLMHLENYSSDMLELIDMYTALESNLPAEKLEEINKYKKQIDIDFLHDDLKDLLKSCKEGTERTKNIVLDLKNFSRLGEIVLTELDIPKEIDTTLNILNNKLKDRITIHKDFASDLPKIEAYGGQLNQIFMNIIDNAQYAIKDKGDIYISAKREGDNIIMSFRDTGRGMSQTEMAKVFEPFFTTKPVGAGTGMGMSITYKVIQNHKGSVTIDSKEGVGTTFTITLPISHGEDEAESATQEEIILLGENNAKI